WPMRAGAGHDGVGLSHPLAFHVRDLISSEGRRRKKSNDSQPGNDSAVGASVSHVSPPMKTGVELGKKAIVVIGPSEVFAQNLIPRHNKSAKCSEGLYGAVTIPPICRGLASREDRRDTAG